jgi:hypothetical protein
MQTLATYKKRTDETLEICFWKILANICSNQIKHSQHMSEVYVTSR